MRYRLKTSSPVGAALRGAGAGAILLVLFWALGLPLDLKLAVVLFLVAFFTCASSCYQSVKQPAAHPGPGADILMGAVSWNFSLSAPEEIGPFVEMVGSHQSDPGTWKPDETIGENGIITVGFHQFWKDDEESLVTLDLEAPDGAPWTNASLIHALHHRLKDGADLGDHVYFEGLRRVGPAQYLLMLGS